MRFKDLKAGEHITLDSGFICMCKGAHLVKEDAKGLYLTCTEGNHYLDGMDDSAGNLLGVLDKPKEVDLVNP